MNWVNHDTYLHQNLSYLEFLFKLYGLHLNLLGVIQLDVLYFLTLKYACIIPINIFDIKVLLINDFHKYI